MTSVRRMCYIVFGTPDVEASASALIEADDDAGAFVCQ
jgi:hypothetical protein